jgi:hypothetical protein
MGKISRIQMFLKFFDNFYNLALDMLHLLDLD